MFRCMSIRKDSEAGVKYGSLCYCVNFLVCLMTQTPALICSTNSEQDGYDFRGIIIITPVAAKTPYY